MTYYKSGEDIYNEMTSTTDIDYDEGSLLYYVQKPVAEEISFLSLMLDESIKRMTVTDAYENGYIEDIEKKCADLGIYRKEATYATTELTLTGNSKAKLPSGSKIATKEGIVFVTNNQVIIDDSGMATVNATALNKGSKYNVEANTLINFVIQYQGIISVTNEIEVRDGYDEESDESLVQRYFEYVMSDETSGNVAHYKKWCKEIQGIGGANIYENTDENKQPKNGHVLCVLCDSNNRAIKDEEKLKEVADYIELRRPACSAVHVQSAIELTLSFSCDILYNPKTTSFETAKDTIFNCINDYLEKNAFNLTELDINKLESLAYSSDSIIMLKNFKVTINDKEYSVNDKVSVGADTVIVLSKEKSVINEIEV